ncbi:MAG TPA: MFS transporter, partial [Steroidobacteraceae bacterium]|nr:MFS transporter [Steroidobacteraceae bacterium]
MQWTKSQKNVVLAAYLGWTLDAFDFFLMVFMFKDIASTFHVDVKNVAEATFLTLAARPIGAFIFGRLADRFGRKPTLIWNILAFSILEAASGFAPSLMTFLVLRFLFGIAMGGEWGIGSALTFETIPLRARGVVSGLLQAGYPSGYFVASIATFFLYDALGWRYMFLLGIVPAILVFFIRMGVDESPAFIEKRLKKQEHGLIEVIAREWKLALYAILLMTAFNFFSHGSQDAYPNLFLKIQHGFDTKTLSLMTAISQIGAICGGIGFGFLSERIGRRRAIVFAALLALPVMPFWA